MNSTPMTPTTFPGLVDSLRWMAKAGQTTAVSALTRAGAKLRDACRFLAEPTSEATMENLEESWMDTAKTAKLPAWYLEPPEKRAGPLRRVLEAQAKVADRYYPSVADALVGIGLALDAVKPQASVFDPGSYVIGRNDGVDIPHKLSVKFGISEPVQAAPYARFARLFDLPIPMAATAYVEEGRDKPPLSLEWQDLFKFLEIVNCLDGSDLRLPTLAELAIFYGRTEGFFEPSTSARRLGILEMAEDSSSSPLLVGMHSWFGAESVFAEGARNSLKQFRLAFTFGG